MLKILSLATFVLAGAGLFGVIHDIPAEFICIPVHPPRTALRLEPTSRTRIHCRTAMYPRIAYVTWCSPDVLVMWWDRTTPSVV